VRPAQPYCPKHGTPTQSDIRCSTCSSVAACTSRRIKGTRSVAAAVTERGRRTTPSASPRRHSVLGPQRRRVQRHGPMCGGPRGGSGHRRPCDPPGAHAGSARGGGPA
jgi:hypothetical protein